VHHGGQLKGRLPGLARRRQHDFPIRESAGCRVDFHGHVGDQTLPGHERRPQLLSNGGNGAP
jgi:hypothetical protein